MNIPERAGITMAEELEIKAQEVKQKLHYGNDASIDRKAEKWVLEPLIPHRGITILDGLGASGKSWFAMDLSYSISLGQTFLGKFPVKKSGKVLYLTAEESEGAFVERLDMIQQHYPESKGNFIWLSLLEEGVNISSYLCTKKKGERLYTETAEILRELIKEIQPVVVVLDSLINFFGMNENDSEDVVYFYEVLKYFIREYKVNFLLLHHQNKEGMRNQSDDVISFRGSGVLREQARSRIIYKNVDLGDGEFARKIILEKSNYYSKLKDEYKLSEGIYLKFDGGKHVYDEAFHRWAMSKEAEKKDGKKNGNKKEQKEEDYDYEIPF